MSTTGDDVDILYPITLLSALAAGVIATLTSLLGLLRTGAHVQPDVPVWRFLLSHRLTDGALALGILSLAISVAVHSRWGHGPGTVSPMGLGRLLVEHRAFPAAGAILLVAFFLALYRKRKLRSP